MTPREMVSTTLFWVIALCFGCGVGGAVMVENMVKGSWLGSILLRLPITSHCFLASPARA